MTEKRIRNWLERKRKKDARAAADAAAAVAMGAPAGGGGGGVGGASAADVSDLVTAAGSFAGYGNHGNGSGAAPLNGSVLGNGATAGAGIATLALSADAKARAAEKKGMLQRQTSGMLRPRKEQAMSEWIMKAKEGWRSKRKGRISKKRKHEGGGGGGAGMAADDANGNASRRPKRSRKELLRDIKQLKAENLALAQYIVASRAKFGVAFPD